MDNITAINLTAEIQKATSAVVMLQGIPEYSPEKQKPYWALVVETANAMLRAAGAK